MRCYRFNMAAGTQKEGSLSVGEDWAKMVDQFWAVTGRGPPPARIPRYLELKPALETAAAAADKALPRTHRRTKYIINPSPQQISFLKRVREGGHSARAFTGGYVEEE